jgi:hypothetical protein
VRKSLLFLIVFMFVFATAQASHPTILDKSENLIVHAYQPTGICESVSSYGGVLAIGNGASVDFYDMAVPSAPVLLGNVVAQARVIKVKNFGDTTVMVAGDFWSNSFIVNIVDSSDPANAVILGQTSVSSMVHAIAKSGSTVYLSLNYSTVIVDISMPSSPSQVGTFESSMSSEARGDRLYLGTSDGALRIMDISTPASPVEIGSIDYDSSIYGLAISDDEQTAYLGRYGLQIVDISTPDTPVHVGEYTQSQYFFVSDIAMTSAGLYFLGDEGIYLVDPTIPTAPTLSGFFASNRYNTGISADATLPDYCYVAAGAGALALDFSTPDTPTDAASLITGYYIKNLVVQDIVTKDGKQAPDTDVQVNTASALGGVGRFRYLADSHDIFQYLPPLFATLFGVKLEGLDVVKTGSSSTDPIAVATQDDVRLVSASTGVEPLLSTIDLYGWGKRLCFDDDKIAVSTSSAPTITFLDVADPENPSIEHTENVGETVVDLDWCEGHSVLSIVTGTSPEQVKLYNALVAVAPVLLSAFSPGSNIVAVDVFENFMYVADYQNNIYVYDITDGTNPVQVGTFDMATFTVTAALAVGRPSALKDGEIYLYAAVMDRGLVVLDVTNPAEISQVAWFNTADEASAVALHDDLIFVGDGFAGLYVMELDLETPVMFSRFSAEAGEACATLHWDIVGDQAIEGVRIHRENADGSDQRVFPGEGLLDPISTTYADHAVSPGAGYYYTLSVVTSTGEIKSDRIAVSIPAYVARIHSNHPNPFNPSTRISYSLAEPGRAILSVYDVGGRLVKTLVDAHLDAGLRTVAWHGVDEAGNRVASGTYFLRLETGKEIRTRKVMLAK